MELEIDTMKGYSVANGLNATTSLSIKSNVIEQQFAKKSGEGLDSSLYMRANLSRGAGRMRHWTLLQTQAASFWDSARGWNGAALGHKHGNVRRTGK